MDQIILNAVSGGVSGKLAEALNATAKNEICRRGTIRRWCVTVK